MHTDRKSQPLFQCACCCWLYNKHHHMLSLLILLTFHYFFPHKLNQPKSGIHNIYGHNSPEDVGDFLITKQLHVNSQRNFIHTVIGQLSFSTACTLQTQLLCKLQELQPLQRIIIFTAKIKQTKFHISSHNIPQGDTGLHCVSANCIYMYIPKASQLIGVHEETSNIIVAFACTLDTITHLLLVFHIH